MDNMIIKSKNLKDHPKDIIEAFNIFDKVGMQLNPEKCTFEVKARKL